MPSRRLPIYLLLDCSESMAGDAIQAVGNGVATLVAQLRKDPRALETVYLSVIAFSREARQISPLTDILKFEAPRLSIRPGTALGSALRLLADCMRRDLTKTTPEAKGDYKPLVFLLTDGQPTDEWEPAAIALKSAHDPKLADINAIGCGPDVDLEMLYRITDSVFLLTDLSPAAFQKLFVWLTASIQNASAGVSRGLDPDSIRLPAIPSDAITIAPRETSAKGLPRQVFLHARCSKTKRYYLMRYSRAQYAEAYEPVTSHPLESLEEGDAALLPPINSSLLNGSPPCPYCESPGAGLCPCGTLFCVPKDAADGVICPSCSATLGWGGDSSFDIKRSVG